MSKVDHHIHTSKHSPDSSLDPHEMIDRALEVGLDVVVITEHDYQWLPDELAELNARANPRGLTILSGVEVSAREGHFLVYGLPELKSVGVEAGIRLRDLSRIAKANDAVLVAAHPFRWGQDFWQIFRENGPVFDAMEYVSNNVSPDTRAQARNFLNHHPLMRTGSSDGHEAAAVGCYYSEFPQTIRSMGDFKAAIRSGEGKPRHTPGAWQAAGPI